MRDTTSERQIHPLELYSSDDYDCDYDIHYFASSISPYVVSPEDYEVFEHLQGPGLSRWTFEDDLSERSISPILSYSYSIDSNFMFPDVRPEPSLEGYSRIFRAGLTNTSLRISHRISTASDRLREAFRISKHKLQSWIVGAFRLTRT